MYGKPVALQQYLDDVFPKKVNILSPLPIPVKVSISSGGKRPPVPRITVQAFRWKPSRLIGA